MKRAHSVLGAIVSRSLFILLVIIVMHCRAHARDSRDSLSLHVFVKSSDCSRCLIVVDNIIRELKDRNIPLSQRIVLESSRVIEAKRISEQYTWPVQVIPDNGSLRKSLNISNHNVWAIISGDSVVASGSLLTQYGIDRLWEYVESIEKSDRWEIIQESEKYIIESDSLILTDIMMGSVSDNGTMAIAQMKQRAVAFLDIAHATLTGMLQITDSIARSLLRGEEQLCLRPEFGCDFEKIQVFDCFLIDTTQLGIFFSIPVIGPNTRTGVGLMIEDKSHFLRYDVERKRIVSCKRLSDVSPFLSHVAPRFISFDGRTLVIGSALTQGTTSYDSVLTAHTIDIETGEHRSSFPLDSAHRVGNLQLHQSSAHTAIIRSNVFAVHSFGSKLANITTGEEVFIEETNIFRHPINSMPRYDYSAPLTRDGEIERVMQILKSAPIRSFGLVQCAPDLLCLRFVQKMDSETSRYFIQVYELSPLRFICELPFEGGAVSYDTHHDRLIGVQRDGERYLLKTFVLKRPR